MIKELRNTSYSIRMAILGSRTQMCLHSNVSKLSGAQANTACKALVVHRQCSYYHKSKIEKGVAELRGGGGERWGAVTKSSKYQLYVIRD